MWLVVTVWVLQSLEGWRGEEWGRGKGEGGKGEGVRGVGQG